MKLLLTIFICLFCSAAIAQTTPMSFTNRTTDFTAPGRGGQHWGTSNWDGVFVPLLPAGNARPKNFYSRFNWLDIENNGSQGQNGTIGNYSWGVFDAFVNQAIDSGAMFSFGLMPVCTGCGSFGEPPAYLQALMVTEGKPCPTVSGNIEPNYQSIQWVTRYAALMHAVANHIATTSRNGHSFTSAFLGYDLRHYGEFGEGNGFNTGTGSGNVPSSAQVTPLYLSRMVDSAISIFPNVQLTIPMSYVAPNNDYTIADGNTDTTAAYHALTSSNTYGRIGWRRDNIGDNGYNAYLTGTTATNNGIPLLPLIMKCYQVAPIGGEPADDYCGTSRGSSVYYDVFTEDTLFHMSYFGNGNYPILCTNNAVVNCSSNTPANKSNGGDSLVVHMTSASAQEGYRLLLTGGNTPTSPVVGGAFNIVVNWQNTGLAPVYEVWPVTYELRAHTGGTVAKSWTSHFTPRLFQPRFTDSVVTDNETLTGVSAGTYDLMMIIRDPAGYKSPLPLAINGANSDGSFTLRSSIVITSSGVPVANAGAPQTINLPTSSVTLDGTASSGTITGYSWTQVSGPNTATLATPTTATTTASGLVIGTYIFQLSLNGGVSTSTTSVTVNPAPAPSSNIFTTQTPAGGTSNDGPQPGGITGIETGVKFTSSLPGFITGVRFYKIAGDAGIHTGELYSYPGGGLLASALYTGETTSGWQTVTFSSPVPITAGTTYVSATFNSLGNYTFTDGFFATALTNSPLTALADGTNGPNAIYIYTNLPAFPTSSSGTKPNYWQDVVFSAATVTANAGPDQNINLPSTSTTLNGSSSTGTITSYTWSRISGPSTPTIATSTSVSTSVTGLILGVYVFQLSVNAGASTDNITVTVNPAPPPATVNFIGGLRKGARKGFILKTTIDKSFNPDFNSDFSK